MAKSQHAVAAIRDLFEQFGQEDYLGEPVSKLEHSLQCGLLAGENGEKVEVVLGSFLHDIGHLIGEKKAHKRMETEDGVNIGAYNHAILGAEFLGDLGFPSDVTDLVRFHVQAKRYLCAVDPEYRQKLSAASVATLKLQGGLMSENQIVAFEKRFNYKEIVKVRHFDDLAKDGNKVSSQHMEKFLEKIRNYLERRAID